MGYADPLKILGLALAMALLGWPPKAADLRAPLHRLVTSLAAKSRAGAGAGLALAALGGLCGAAAVWLAVGQVADLSKAVIPYQAAGAGEIVISALLLGFALELRHGREPPETPEALALRWTRGVIAPVLLYALGGLYAAMIYGGALEAWKALRAEPSAEASASWARRPIALVHYPAARVAALAACVVQGRRAWRRLETAPATPDPWHPGWAAAALAGAPRRVVAATLVVLLLCALILRW